MIVNWQARMASSAVWWLWGVTPAQQSDKTSISVSGKAARSTMALLITQISAVSYTHLTLPTTPYV